MNCFSMKKSFVFNRHLRHFRHNFRFSTVSVTQVTQVTQEQNIFFREKLNSNGRLQIPVSQKRKKRLPRM